MVAVASQVVWFLASAYTVPAVNGGALAPVYGA